MGTVSHTSGSASCGTHIKIRVCGSARTHMLAATRMACKRMPTRARMASRASFVVSIRILNFCVLECTEQLSSKRKGVPYLSPHGGLVPDSSLCLGGNVRPGNDAPAARSHLPYCRHFFILPNLSRVDDGSGKANLEGFLLQRPPGMTT